MAPPSPATGTQSQNSTVACGSPAPQPSFTQQYIYFGDLRESPVLWVFKIDQATGALTEMPWSPMETINGTLSATMDPTHKFFYLSSRTTLGTTGRPPVTIETYAVPQDDSKPQNRSSVEAYSSDLTTLFDPQGKLFYQLPRSGIGEMIPWTVDANGTAVQAGDKVPLNVAWPTTYAYKAEGNLVLIAHGTGADKPVHSEDGIAVYRQNCSTGGLTLLKDNVLADGANFLNAPSNGDFVEGWGVERVPRLNFPYRVNPQTGDLTLLPDSQVRGLMQTNFDLSGKFAVGRMQEISGSESVAVFSLDPNKGLVETDRYIFPLSNGNEQRILSPPIFDLSGNYIYSSSSDFLVALRLDRNTGKLSLVPGYPEVRRNTFEPSFIVAH
jgi:6-phosphogluconolactonase (cycloisomerase 2 family)